MTLRTENLVQALEVWTPDEAGQKLSQDTSWYDHWGAAADASVGLEFARGEDLPGLVWKHRMPVILSGDEFSGSRRAEALSADGITALVGYPCFAGDSLRGVVVFLLNEGETAQGAFEVWSRDQRDELGLTSSYFVRLNRIRLISPLVKFPRGAGLPGQVWERRAPKLIDGLGSSIDFMRASGARDDGLNVGLGLPVMNTEHDLKSVLVLLSAARSPQAKVFEIWRPSEKNKLALESYACGPYVDLGPMSRRQGFAVGSGVVGRAAELGKPIVHCDLSEIDGARGRKASEYGLTTSLAIPVYVGEHLGAVVNFIS
jgi:hypothetical protein